MKPIVRKYSSVIHGNYFVKSIKYGLIMGACLSIGLLVRYLLLVPPSSPTSFYDNIIMLVVMCICLYFYRKNLPEKKMSFKEAWLTGFFSCCIASVIYGIFLYFYILQIDSQMPERCIEVLKQVPEYSNYSDEQFKLMTGVSTITLQSVFYNIITAVILALVTGIFFGNEKSSVYQKQEKQ